MNNLRKQWRGIASSLLAFAAFSILTGCASTKVEVAGNSPATSLCEQAGQSGTTLVLWWPQWRTDQKDVETREADAEQGIQNWLRSSRCFPAHVVRRATVENLLPPDQLARMMVEAEPEVTRVLVFTVRELGPFVKLFSSFALVEGGTEVVVHVAASDLRTPDRDHDFLIHWTRGGPWYLQGVAGLAADMESALTAGFNGATQR